VQFVPCFCRFVARRWRAAGPVPRVHSIARRNAPKEPTMTERFIAPALTFLVLIAGHVAIVGALLGGTAAPKAEQTVMARAAAEQVVAKRAS
jgi:hypothetical protein